MRFSESFVPFVKKNSVILWIGAYILFSSVSNNPFFPIYLSTSVSLLMMELVLIIILSDIRKDMWKLYKIDPLYFRKQHRFLILIIVIFYSWFLTFSHSHGRPTWFQIAYKIFELIASAYLWFIPGFRIGQNVKMPDGNNKEPAQKTD
jgi:hypothetical protein